MARSVSAGTHGHFRSWGETGCAIRLSATAALDPEPTCRAVLVSLAVRFDQATKSRQDQPCETRGAPSTRCRPLTDNISLAEGLH
jgi:hypothetical protein